MENELIINKKNMVSLVTDNPLGELIKPLSHEILLFDSYVAGTTHIKDETVFDEIKVGDKLILQREPENRFDENAILVLDDKKRKLGYIPEKDNIVFSRLMDAGKYLIAKIDRMEEKGSFRQINISIYLVDF
ncbi:MAG: HIRAN domain-containing protein [Lachnospiraceae bacterium]|nr:HIRAN domain-containing protein [Lachnospiraceae bacterium]